MHFLCCYYYWLWTIYSEWVGWVWTMCIYVWTKPTARLMEFGGILTSSLTIWIPIKHQKVKFQMNGCKPFMVRRGYIQPQISLSEILTDNGI